MKTEITLDIYTTNSNLAWFAMKMLPNERKKTKIMTIVPSIFWLKTKN